MPPEWLSPLWYELWYWSAMASFTLGFSLRTEGHRHVPHRGPALLIANHQSYIDPLAIGLAARRHLFFLARKTLFRKRFFGAYLRSVNCIPVAQAGVATEGLKTALELLKAGRALLLFPEGERTHTGSMQSLRPGIQLLIKRAAVPIIPVGIAGAYQAYPRTRKFPRLAPLFLPATEASLAVSIGRPLCADRLQGLSREGLLEELFRQIQTVQQRAECLRRKP